VDRIRRHVIFIGVEHSVAVSVLAEYESVESTPERASTKTQHGLTNIFGDCELRVLALR
jgi:hypothetical protein